MCPDFKDLKGKRQRFLEDSKGLNDLKLSQEAQEDKPLFHSWMNIQIELRNF